MNIICINNLLPSDFQPFSGKSNSYCSEQSEQQLLPQMREPIRMLKGLFQYWNYTNTIYFKHQPLTFTHKILSATVKFLQYLLCIWIVRFNVTVDIITICSFCRLLVFTLSATTNLGAGQIFFLAFTPFILATRFAIALLQLELSIMLSIAGKQNNQRTLTSPSSTCQPWLQKLGGVDIWAYTSAPNVWYVIGTPYMQ